MPAEPSPKLVTLTIDGVSYSAPQPVAERLAVLEDELQQLKRRGEAECARASLEGAAHALCGNAIRTEGRSDLEVKRMIAERILGKSLDGRTDEYVQGAFDLALEMNATAAPAAFQRLSGSPS